MGALANSEDPDEMLYYALFAKPNSIFREFYERFAQPSYIDDILIFGMKMSFISSSEVKNAYFISGKTTNEIYLFSLHEMK